MDNGTGAFRSAQDVSFFALPPALSHATRVKQFPPTVGAGWLPVLASSAVMSIALLGDVLLYAVLPLHAAAFGVSLAWVGILLSANRFVRVVAYGAIARTTHHFGPRAMCIVSVFTAALSTALYGLAEGPWLLLAARVLWGITFATLVLVTLSYAVEDRGKAGSRVGVSHSIWSIGPLAVLLGGTWFVSTIGPREIFIWLGVLGIAALPFALMLPRLDASTRPKPKNTRGLLSKPNAMEAIVFIVGATADGLFSFCATIMVAEHMPMEAAVVVGGALLALRDVGKTVCAPVAGYLGDRFGPHRIFAVLLFIVISGLVLIAADWLITGAVFMLFAKAGAMTLAPVVIVHDTPAAEPTMPDLARMQAARDLGAAIGPLAAGFLIALYTPHQMHAFAAIVLAGAVVWWLWETRRVRQPSA